jgi:hypothetical protein
MSQGIQFYVGYTLVDITATGKTRGNDPDDVERNQHRNWETVVQCMGLRTQPQNIQTPTVIEAELTDYDFGEFYQGHNKIWQWVWSVEQSEVYDIPGNKLGGLQKDFEQVPVITCLTETARFMLPIFYPYGSIKNVYFKQIDLKLNN